MHKPLIKGNNRIMLQFKKTLCNFENYDIYASEKKNDCIMLVLGCSGAFSF